MGKFDKENLPVIDIKQLESLFSDLILWYDKRYCKTKEGAYEVIGEYMTSVGKEQPETTATALSHSVSKNEERVSVCGTCGFSAERRRIENTACINCPNP